MLLHLSYISNILNRPHANDYTHDYGSGGGAVFGREDFRGIEIDEAHCGRCDEGFSEE